MDKHNQVEIFRERLDRLIEGFVSEFNISYCEVIGILAMKLIALTIKPK